MNMNLFRIEIPSECQTRLIKLTDWYSGKEVPWQWIGPRRYQISGSMFDILKDSSVEELNKKEDYFRHLAIDNIEDFFSLRYSTETEERNIKLSLLGNLRHIYLIRHLKDKLSPSSN